jgi:hypothetical protein
MALLNGKKLEIKLLLLKTPIKQLVALSTDLVDQASDYPDQ